MRRCAEWAAAEMRRIGLENVRLIDTPGHPLVYADWLARRGRADGPLLRPLRRAAGRSARSVEVAAVRGHRPRRRDLRARRGRRQGPGVHALQGHRSAHEAERPPAGQHEGRSSRAKRRSAARTSTSSSGSTPGSSPRDVVVISDTEMFDRGVPSICYGLRGLAYFQIDLRGTKGDLHSGSFGGAVANPAIVLAQLLAQMKDKSGTHQDPRASTTTCGRCARRSGRSSSGCRSTRRRYKKHLGAPRLFGETRLHARSSACGRGRRFEVNGLLSGFTGEGAKTVIPAVAMAKVSMRLVPNQDPEKIAELFEAYVKKIAPKTVELKVTRLHGGKPWMTDFDNRLRAGGRPRHREGLRQAAGVHARGRLDPGRARLPGGARRAGRALRRSACPTRTCTRRTRSSTSTTSTTGSSPRRSCTRR